VICPECRTEQDFADGRCAGCGAAGAVRCPKCRGWVAKGEKFCSACGAKIPTHADRLRAVQRNRDRQETEDKVNRGRRWMLIVAVLTLFASVFSYFSGMSNLEKRRREMETEFRGMTPAERDAQLKEDIGMTWEEELAQGRGEVLLQTTILVVLGAAYLGLWWWAQKNAFAAALTALLLFATVQFISFLMEPASVFRGIIIKIPIVMALSTAVSAGYRQRAQRRGRPA
jgi:hypothetical protein